MRVVSRRSVSKWRIRRVVGVGVLRSRGRRVRSGSGMTISSRRRSRGLLITLYDWCNFGVSGFLFCFPEKAFLCAVLLSLLPRLSEHIRPHCMMSGLLFSCSASAWYELMVYDLLPLERNDMAVRNSCWICICLQYKQNS